MQTHVCMVGFACLSIQNIMPEDCLCYVQLTKRMFTKVPTSNSLPSFLFCVSQESYICTYYMAWSLSIISRILFDTPSLETHVRENAGISICSSESKAEEGYVKIFNGGERHSLSFTLFKINIKNIFSSSDTCVRSKSRGDRYQQKCVYLTLLVRKQARHLIVLM